MSAAGSAAVEGGCRAERVKQRRASHRRESWEGEQADRRHQKQELGGQAGGNERNRLPWAVWKRGPLGWHGVGEGQLHQKT